MEEARYQTKEEKEKARKRARRKKKLRRIIPLVSVAVFLILLVLQALGITTSPRIREEGLTFLVLSVGQASCSVLFTEDGAVMIDTGSNASISRVRPALDYYGIDSLEALILTHADIDHSGGLDIVLDEIPVKTAVMSKSTYEAVTDMRVGKRLNEAIEDGSTELMLVTVGDTIPHGANAFRVLAPSTDGVDGNEGSLILSFSYGETDIILTGDADEAGELTALQQLRVDPDYRCEILLVGHHGSNTSSSEPFLSFIRPQYAVISCEAGNPYGHPDIRTLQRLEAVGATVLRTDLRGSVILYSDGKSVEIQK